MTEATSFYHYCSTSTFHAIIESRSIRLSSLSLSNDTQEGKLVTQALVRLGTRDSLTPERLLRLLDLFAGIERGMDGLGFCLSEEGDLLSQWRGYASDGAGISIGFSRPYIHWLADRQIKQGDTLFSIGQAIYDPDLQEKEVEPIYISAKEWIAQGAFDAKGLRGLLDTRTTEESSRDDKRIDLALYSLQSELLRLASNLFLFKATAFREEREWRLLSYMASKLFDDCGFYPRGDRLVPYRTLPLAESERPPIVDVVLGPKHLTPISVVAHFLKMSGFGEIPIRRSEASYR